MRLRWTWWLLGIGLFWTDAPVWGQTTSSRVVDSPNIPFTSPSSLTPPTSLIKGGVQAETFIGRDSHFPPLIHPLPRGARAFFQTSPTDLDPPKSPLKRGTLTEFSPLNQGSRGGSEGLKKDPRGVVQKLSQTETTPQPQTTPQPAAQELDLKPEIIKNSPVLQRWLKKVPNVLEEIRNDPSFRTRLRLGYSQFPSTDGAPGFNVGVEDVFMGRTGLTVSGDYQRSFNGERESFGTDLRYYVLPLGSYVNVAPQVGYRNLTTGNFSTDGVNVGARLMLALSRTGAADISLTQSFVSPGSRDEVGMTTLSFGYAVTQNLRLSTDIQKQNSREEKDSRVGIVLEWMP